MRQYLLTHHPWSVARVWFSPRSCSPQCPSRQALHQRGEAVNMAVGRSTTLIIARPYLIWAVIIHPQTMIIYFNNFHKMH